MKFVIENKLPSLNELLAACNRNHFVGAKLKRDVEEMIGWFIQKAVNAGTLHPTDKPVRFRIVWHERTKKRDPDNIVSGKKYILDALQKQGILPNDNRKYVKGFTDEIVDDTRDYVEVEIEEE